MPSRHEIETRIAQMVNAARWANEEPSPEDRDLVPDDLWGDMERAVRVSSDLTARQIVSDLAYKVAGRQAEATLQALDAAYTTETPPGDKTDPPAPGFSLLSEPGDPGRPAVIDAMAGKSPLDRNLDGSTADSRLLNAMLGNRPGNA